MKCLCKTIVKNTRHSVPICNDNLFWIKKEPVHPSCSPPDNPNDNTCTEDNCCCANGVECKITEVDDWDNVPGVNNVGHWYIDWTNTNSLTPTDPAPQAFGFSFDSTMRPIGWDNDEYWNLEKPPTCRTPAKYYHWATDEPKNFKAIGKGYKDKSKLYP